MSQQEERRVREFWITNEQTVLPYFDNSHLPQVDKARFSLGWVHVREVDPSAPDYQRMLEMKQDDWIEACQDADKYKKLCEELAGALEKARHYLLHKLKLSFGSEKQIETFDEALSAYREAVKR